MLVNSYPDTVLSTPAVVIIATCDIYWILDLHTFVSKYNLFQALIILTHFIPHLASIQVVRRLSRDCVRTWLPPYNLTAFTQRFLDGFYRLGNLAHIFITHIVLRVLSSDGLYALQLRETSF
ncbi:hypothetical protein F4774DRAFT_246611 [Daldinia eschscholtzii]|nr:hypothetical protein F4774DRAFT_246611 [Daldinia eschscholtzii]